MTTGEKENSIFERKNSSNIHPNTRGAGAPHSRFENISDSDEEFSPPAPKSSVSADERLQQIGKAKEEGNKLITKGEFKAAAAQYRKGIKFAEDLAKTKPAPNPIQASDAKEVGFVAVMLVCEQFGRVAASHGLSLAMMTRGQLELSLQLNLAMAELKQEHWAGARTAATAALAIDPKNVKALFRRGSAQVTPLPSGAAPLTGSATTAQ